MRRMGCALLVLAGCVTHGGLGDGTGTVNAAGHVDVTTQYDLYAQTPLYFTGTVSLTGSVWKASGTVTGTLDTNQLGTWTASQ